MFEYVLPDSVIVEELFGDHDETLHAEEVRYIAGSANKRRLEFTSARYCARRALQRLGMAREVMVPGTYGEPRWPAGVVGSMTHCEGYRAAAVAPDDCVAAIGIDAEPNLPLPDGLLNLVVGPEEAANIRSLTLISPDVAFDRVFFCVKESAYKAWFRFGSRRIGFHDARAFVGCDGGFAVAMPSVGGWSSDAVGSFEVRGKWRVHGGLIVSAVVCGDCS